MRATTLTLTLTPTLMLMLMLTLTPYTVHTIPYHTIPARDSDTVPDNGSLFKATSRRAVGIVLYYYSDLGPNNGEAITTLCNLPTFLMCRVETEYTGRAGLAIMRPD